jgi:hypothetical protein
MVFHAPAEYLNIVYVDHGEVIQVFFEELIHYFLKRTWGIGLTEWQHQELK